MREAKLLRVCELDPKEIDTSNRLRPVTEAGVESLIASYKDTGVLKDEVLVREVRHQKNALKLIAGGHRVEMCFRLGIKVPAKIYDCTDEWARMMEIDDNLAGAEMNALDTAVFLAQRKAVYERLHPETKQGVAGGLARQGLASDIVSFADATSEKFGVSKRHVERMIAAGRKLDGRDVQLLRQAPRPVTFKDLSEISKISDTVERYEVVEALSEGRAKSATDARNQYAEKEHGPKPIKDPVEQELAALLNAYRRAGQAARRRFVRREIETLEALVAEEGGAA